MERQGLQEVSVFALLYLHKSALLSCTQFHCEPKTAMKPKPHSFKKLNSPVPVHFFKMWPAETVNTTK